MGDLEYLHGLHPDPPPLLLELETLGRGDRIPIVSRATGRLLSTLVHAMQANRVLEIGTAYGYSAVDVINQPALEVLRTFPQRNLDIVFIDALKTEYEGYLELTVPLLKRSGLVIVDNLLWDGESAQAPRPDDSPDTIALRAFNVKFLSHPQLDATIVPLGDGTGIGSRIA